MKRIEREKVIRNAYRSIILALTACCIFLGVVLVVHELAREYEVGKTESEAQCQRSCGKSGRTVCRRATVPPGRNLCGRGCDIGALQCPGLFSGNKVLQDYNVKWTCAIGKNMQRKFSITGTGVILLGEYPLIFTIFDDNGAQVATASTRLKVVKDLSEEQKHFSLLTIGDSLSCNTATYEQLNLRTDNQIIYMGTRGVGGSLTEARRGFSAANYLTDAPYTMEDPHEDVQPFYDKETDSFSWRHYKEKTGFHPDAIELFLGTNGLDVDPMENGDNIAAIVKNIHEEDPDLPIYLVHTIYPANQDGIGSWNNKGYALYGDRYKYEEDQKVFHLMTYLEDILADEPYLYFVPASICVDSANNFDMTEEPVNPYSDEMQEVPTDAVHPGRAAYEQIADCLYSVICGTESEWE